MCLGWPSVHVFSKKLAVGQIQVAILRAILVRSSLRTPWLCDYAVDGKL